MAWSTVMESLPAPPQTKTPPVKLNEPCATPSMLTLALPCTPSNWTRMVSFAFRAEDVQRGLTGLHRIRSDADAGGDEDRDRRGGRAGQVVDGVPRRSRFRGSRTWFVRILPDSMVAVPWAGVATPVIVIGETLSSLARTSISLEVEGFGRIEILDR